MSFRYFVIGSGSIGRRHAENLTTLGAEVTHYGWRGIDLDAALSEIAACNGQAGVVIATATKVRLPLITEDERVTQNLGQERNAMFLDFMADFMALAEGRETKNPHIPRLDRVKDVCHVIIAKAWGVHEFKGQLGETLHDFRAHWRTQRQQGSGRKKFSSDRRETTD